MDNVFYRVCPNLLLTMTGRRASNRPSPLLTRRSSRLRRARSSGNASYLFPGNLALDPRSDPVRKKPSFQSLYDVGI